jgi:hypothetical protein
VQEVRVATGLILLAFLSALVTFGWTKARRRFGLGVTNRTYGITFVVIFMLILVVWANGHV